METVCLLSKNVKNTRFSAKVLKYILDIACAYVNALPGFTTCGNSHSSDEKSQVNQRVAPICGKNGCVFQFPQKTHAETDLPQG